MSVANGLVAFLGGAANKGSAILDDRRKELQDMRKAQMLEELRLSTAKSLKDYEWGHQATRANASFSTIEGDEMVYRNDQSNVINRRAATQDELAARDELAAERRRKGEAHDQGIRESNNRMRNDNARTANDGARVRAAGRAADAAAASNAPSLERYVSAAMDMYEDDIKHSTVSPSYARQVIRNVIASGMSSQGKDFNIESVLPTLDRQLQGTQRGRTVDGTTGDMSRWSLDTQREYWKDK